VITGSSRGLGLALAEEFAKEGARLVLAARDPRELEAARELLLARRVVRNQADVLLVPCDLRDETQAERMIQAAIERFQRVSVLVNCAGTITVGPVEDQPVSAFADAIESNYYSAVYSALAVIPQMLARGEGSIVNIASIGGKLAIPHLLPYTASKFALVGFSQGLHAELRSKGIRVTTVCPGLMRTGSHIQAQFTGDREREYRWFSLGASLPLVSASAKSAARKIVCATLSGAPEIAITPQAIVASRLAQIAPGSTARVMSLINDLMLPPPSNGIDKNPRSGDSVDKREITLLTAAGRLAARRYNQRTSR
jgi:short-subunit dehydrogenase